MTHLIQIFPAPDNKIKLPTKALMKQWITFCLDQFCDNVELEVSFVSEAESQALNKQYRDKDKATNVLSFSMDLPRKSKRKMLGNLILCLPVIQKEATEQDKNFNDHLAHLLIHGCLHLLGYDHVKPKDAKIMEQEEVTILAQLGIDNPYE